MIKIEQTNVVGFSDAIRGMRNPMNSWARSDSGICKGGDNGIGCMNCAAFRCDHDYDGSFQIGNADYKLMMDLAKGGAVHAKYRRMIHVYVDVTAPLYWWKEFDTYKVGTTANSCSTMHKITAKEFTLDDFSHEHLIDCPGNGILPPLSVLKTTIDALNTYRTLYLATNTEPDINCRKLSDECCAKIKKDIWWQLIQLLPSSYNQKRTLDLNYENLAGIYRERRNHKLDEWLDFCRWIEKLPVSNVITLGITSVDALQTPNEIRQALGMPPIPNLSDYIQRVDGPHFGTMADSGNISPNRGTSGEKEK